MDKLNNSISEFNRIQNNFGYLLSFEVSRELYEVGCTDYSVDIYLCNYPKDRNAKILLRFTGVKNLKFGDLDRLVKNFVSISDISTHQIEGVKYSVKEEENETFSFYCNTFCYEIVH